MARPVPELFEVAQVGGRDARGSQRTTQFSWRVKESSVQFSDPVQTRWPSTTAYLWCISVPKPVTGLTSRPRASTYSGGAAGAARRRAGRALGLVVVDDAHPHAAVAQALQRAATISPARPKWKS